MDTGLNTRQELFIQKYVKEHKPASRVYAEVYGGDPSKLTTQVKASQLLSKPKIKNKRKELEKEVRDIFHEHAKDAAKTLIKISKSNKNVAEARKAANDVMRLGGLEPATKQEVKNKTVIKGLTDDSSYEDILTTAYKKIEDAKRTV